MRRNLGPVNAPDAHHEWRSFGACVPSHRRKIAAFMIEASIKSAEVGLILGGCGRAVLWQRDCAGSTRHDTALGSNFL